MKQLTKWEEFVDAIGTFFVTWYKRLTCRHGRIVTLATMKEHIQGSDRFSGFAECPTCKLNFIVSIAADEQERANEHYLGY